MSPALSGQRRDHCRTTLARESRKPNSPSGMRHSGPNRREVLADFEPIDADMGNSAHTAAGPDRVQHVRSHIRGDPADSDPRRLGFSAKDEMWQSDCWFSIPR